MLVSMLRRIHRYDPTESPEPNRSTRRGLAKVHRGISSVKGIRREFTAGIEKDLARSGRSAHPKSEALRRRAASRRRSEGA